MGIPGGDIDQMEPWMLAAAYVAWNTANSAPEAKAPSDEEYRAAVARMTR
jgi:hypothetical protein